jgi:mono/diheme cytochrome c family protein
MCRSSCLLLALFLAGCEQYPSGGDYRIRRDMVDQPSFRPAEDPRPPAEGSIPVEGYEPPLTLPEAERRLVNPIQATAASLAQGEKLYRITCMHCHGAAGHGDGPVAAKMGNVANLTLEKYLRVKDGYIYHVIRMGSGVMPPYAENLSPEERWHVVNYVRKLQKR